MNMSNNFNHYCKRQLIFLFYCNIQKRLFKVIMFLLLAVTCPQFRSKFLFNCSFWVQGVSLKRKSCRMKIKRLFFTKNAKKMFYLNVEKYRSPPSGLATNALPSLDVFMVIPEIVLTSHFTCHISRFTLHIFCM
jgi:hypothetical protein